MPDCRISRWQRRLLLWSGLGLALTGLGQMPIFSRYYVADLPGLGWLGDYRATAALQLGLAAIFLCVLGAMAVDWIGAGRERSRLPLTGWLLGAVAVTGLLRVAQNGAWPLFAPGAIRYLDWSHLGLAVLLGAAAVRPRRTRRMAPGSR